MAKHNRHNKKNLKKRVKKNVRRLKELTAEDLLMNPALLQSPQFQQLPMEKQFQLISQMKQLKTLFSGRAGGVGGGGTAPQTSGNNDPSLFAKINELNNKASRQAKENEQLRTSYQEANEAYKREKELTKELERKSREERDSIARAVKIDDLLKQKRYLELQDEDQQAKTLEKEIKEKKEIAHLNDLREKQKENAKLTSQLDFINQAIKPEGQSRIISENFNQSRSDNLYSQSIFQNQINSFTENGDEPKAEKVETMLYPLDNDDDESFKKKVLSDSSDDDDYENNNNNNNINIVEDIPAPPLEPIEIQAIKAETKLEKENQTRKEQVELYEELLKQKRKNEEDIELTLAQNSFKLPETGKSQLSLEQAKAQLLTDFNEVIQRTNPNLNYLRTITSDIQDAQSFEELKIIRKRINLDEISQETRIKQQKYSREKQEELSQKIKENRKEYERLKELSTPIIPDSTTAQINLEDKKKEAFQELEDIMKLPSNPNEHYRRYMSWYIQHADTTAKINTLIKKMSMDKKNLEDDIEQYKEVQERQKQLIKKFNHPKKSPDRFKFPANMWKVKIYQAKTPDDIQNIVNKMKNS